MKWHLSYPSHICNALVGNWGHIIFPSSSILFTWYFPTIKKSFTLTTIKAQVKIAQNTNNLSNLFHGQSQTEYYMVDSNITLMALYSINSLSFPFESWLHRTSILPHKKCFRYGKQDESHSHFIIYWKMSWITPAYIGIKIKLYSSKCFIQYNPEVKNNLDSFSLQESPTKNGLYCLNTSN